MLLMGDTSVTNTVPPEQILGSLSYSKLELLRGAEDDLERAIEAITSTANSGKIGDGKIFVSDLEQVIRIRTGETGEDAI